MNFNHHLRCFVMILRSWRFTHVWVKCCLSKPCLCKLIDKFHVSSYPGWHILFSLDLFFTCFDTFGPFWRHFIPFWPDFLPVWPLLTHLTFVGPFWHVMNRVAPFWSFWPILTNFTRFNQFWPILTTFDPFSPILSRFDFFVSNFDPFWPVLTRLNHFDLFGLLPNLKIVVFQYILF